MISIFFKKWVPIECSTLFVVITTIIFFKYIYLKILLYELYDSEWHVALNIV